MQDGYVHDFPCWRPQRASKSDTKHTAAATLRFVLSLDLLVFENQPAGALPLALATTGKSSHVKSNSPVERAARPGDTVMSHEYDDHPVTNEAIEAAVTLTVELRHDGNRRQSRNWRPRRSTPHSALVSQALPARTRLNARRMRHSSRRSDGERIRASRFRPRWRHLITQSM